MADAEIRRQTGVIATADDRLILRKVMANHIFTDPSALRVACHTFVTRKGR